ncbi:MAG: NAD(P)-binding protein [Pseudonocardiaceae bacterium]
MDGRSSSPDVDAIVLGAGISGLVSASILVEQGNGRVLVVDEYGHVGGNHIDRAVGATPTGPRCGGWRAAVSPSCSGRR